MSVLGIPGSETSNPVSTGWGTTAAPGGCHAERSACTTGDGGDGEAVADREARVSVVGEQAQFVRPRGERRERKGHAAARRARRVLPPKRWRVGSARRVNSNPVGSGRGTNAVPGGRHRTTGGNARWACAEGGARAPGDGRDGETVADREARVPVVREQAQLVCPRRDRGRDRKGHAAARRPRRVTPTQVVGGVGGARHKDSDPVFWGRRSDAGTACRDGGTGRDGRRACGKSCGRHRNPAHAFRCSASIGKGDASRKIARGSRTEANRYRRACASHQVIRAS